MKILIYTGGLGNQLFGYAFYLYLKKKYSDESVWGIYDRRWLSEHNGFEINRYFDVSLPKSPFWVRILNRIIIKLDAMNIIKARVSMDTRSFSEKNIVVNACKMHTDFLFEDMNFIQFKSFKLSEENQYVLNMIESTHSAFIHVRRGDYYSPNNIARLGGTCPIEFYERAIQCLLKQDPQTRFFVFSDDIQWVKDNMSIPAPIYIDWNKGDDSVIDMFLMSNCKNAIIANSTFSYWGARLGRKKKYVFYPKKWVNPPATPPQICPQNWISF